MTRTLLLVALLLPALAPTSRARQVVTADSIAVVSDSVATGTVPSVDRLRPGPSPRGALWRAAVLPGWGHVYTGRSSRLPFVYGAIGGLVATTLVVHGSYFDYRDAYRYKAWQELVDRGQQPANPYADMEPAYDDLANRIGPVSASVLRQRRDSLRRNRDLSILATGLAWAISVLDAYVGAHLLDFDVGEDLSLRVIPDAASTRPGAVLAWRFPTGTR